MTRDELITKQQLEIEELKSKVKMHVEDFQTIYSRLICVGGPLNDNVLGYNNAQLDYLVPIEKIAYSNLEREDDE